MLHSDDRVYSNDEKYMKVAIELAWKAEGFTNPNPMVGAVIVKNGKIIGMGCHERYGQLHAERNALASCSENPEGSTIYVTLEPCCHYGKTPPCTEALIENKIKRVVIGMVDPNTKVDSKGIKQLTDAGIEVEIGILEEECRKLNPVFIKYITEHAPYVAVKYAMTLDGKIASYTGASKWISGEESREYTHYLRHKYMSIMVGIGTVLLDDPLLNCRLTEYRGRREFKNPIRIVCDTNLRIPIESNLVKTAGEIPLIIATGESILEKEQLLLKKRKLEELGCQVVTIEEKKGKINLELLMKKLGEMKIDSVLVEGGGTLHEQVISQGLADYIYAFIAPMIMGGKDAKTPVEGQGAESPKEAKYFRFVKMTRFGEDILAEYERTDKWRTDKKQTDK